GQTGLAEIDRYAAVLAPAVEFVDHRTLGGGSGHGAKAYLDWVRTLFEISDDVGIRFDDVLGLRADALLVCLTSSGIQRAGGGSYERQFLFLSLFGPPGLVLPLPPFHA